jgi:hypothetical protein
MKWRRWVGGGLLIIVGLLLVCAAGFYASAWYQRWRAEQLFAVIKTMTPGITTEVEYMRAVGPLASSSRQFGGLQPRTLYIANYPKWLDSVCFSDRLRYACDSMARIMPVGTLFAADPTFVNGKLVILGIWEGQIPLRSHCCDRVVFYARRYENNDSDLPKTFDGYLVSHAGEGISMWLTTVQLDERATPPERNSALDFSFRCFTTYRTCGDAALYLQPAPNRPAHNVTQ